jgi:hypothetical protein
MPKHYLFLKGVNSFMSKLIRDERQSGMKAYTEGLLSGCVHFPVEEKPW